MTFLPIAVRELRVASRRRSTFLARFSIAVTAILFGSYMVIVLQGARGMGAPIGTMVFETLAIIGFLFCLLLGAATVDCISEEKREGTLGLLFLTDLKGHDIALGKLCSTSLISFYALLGTFPIVAVCLLLGGVSAREFWQVLLGLLNAFFFAHAAGIFISTFNTKRNSAHFSAMGLLLAYTLGVFLIQPSIVGPAPGKLTGPLQLLNPAQCVFASFNGGYTDYWTSFILVHLNAWAFLIVASFWLPRCWQEKAGKKDAKWRDRFVRNYDQWGFPRERLLSANPFHWLAIRNQLGPWKTWGILLIVDGLWGWGLLRNKFNDLGQIIFTGAILSNHFVFKFMAATAAARNLEEQRHSGTLEFLLSCTPLSVGEIAEGQWLALRDQLLWPMIGMLALDFTLTSIIVGHHFPSDASADKFKYVLFIGAVVVMLLLDTVSIAWVAMWNAMRLRKRRHAAGAAIFLILILPWVLLIGLQLTFLFFRRDPTESGTAAVALWFFVGVMVDLFAGLYAYFQFFNHFRERAAAPIGEEFGLFGQIGRWFGRMAGRRS
jgi:hypothetical protein